MLTILSREVDYFSPGLITFLAAVGRSLGVLMEHFRLGDERRHLKEQLVQAQKMEGLGRLAGGVAHDFNNLLTAILSYAKLGTMALPPAHPVASHMRAISEAADRAASLTGQLLAFSRRQPIEPKVINLNDLTIGLDRMLRQLTGAGIELVFLLEPDLAPVKVDPSQMAQVLINLAVNARDAMPGGGKLIIKTATVAPDPPGTPNLPEAHSGRQVMLSVTDTGIGMTEETKSRVFEPFFTTKEAGKGTGLGLTTCYGFIKQSGGLIEVCSELGKGTTFDIYLPVAEFYLPVAEQTDDARSVKDGVDRLPRGSETVLVVEDEPLILDVVSHTLRDQGYRVLEAANGEEAMRVARAHPDEEIHLLLTDLVMPQMGGRELAERLMAVRPKTKVVFTSGYVDDPLLRYSAPHEFNAFMQKPFLPDAVAFKVREILDGDEPLPHSREPSAPL